MSYIGLEPDPSVSTRLLAITCTRPTLVDGTEVILGHADGFVVEIEVIGEALGPAAVVEGADDDVGVCNQTGDGPYHCTFSYEFPFAAVDFSIRRLGMDLR